jgi:hypothetical protein
MTLWYDLILGEREDGVHPGLTSCKADEDVDEAKKEEKPGRNKGEDVDMVGEHCSTNAGCVC